MIRSDEHCVYPKMMFGSALTYAIYLIGSDSIITRIGSVRFTAYSITVTSIAIVLHFF